MRSVLCPLLLAVVVFGCRKPADDRETKTKQPAPVAPTTVDVTVEDLAAATMAGSTDDDAVRWLRRRYGSSRLRVTARVARIGRNKMNRPRLTLVGQGNPNVAIGANYDGPTSVNDPILLTCGTVSVSDVTVLLGSCERDAL